MGENLDKYFDCFVQVVASIFASFNPPTFKTCLFSCPWKNLDLILLRTDLYKSGASVHLNVILTSSVARLKQTGL